MVRNLRRILFLFCFTIFIGICLFPIEILLACVKCQASRYCKKTFGAKLSYELLVWENGHIICKNGTLLKPGHTQAAFSAAIFSPKLNVKKRKLEADLEVQGLRIVNRKTKPQYFPASSPLSIPFFSVNLNTTICKGEIFLYDYMGTSSIFQRLSFDLDHHIHEEQMFGSISFDWIENEPKLTTHFCRANDSILQLKTDFQSHSIPALYDLIAYFFHSIMPEPVTHWNLRCGKINGNLDLALFNGDPLQLKGEVDLFDLHAENIPLELIGEVDAFHAKLDVDFSSVTSMNGEFFLQGGRLALDKTAEFWQGLWDLRNLHSKISVKEGKVESTVLCGNFMGMDGELVLNWHSPEKLMRMSFQGYSNEVASLFPQSIQSNFREAFADDHFAMKAVVFRSGEGLELEGTLSIEGSEEHLLNFGCLFGHVKEEVEALPEVLPFSLSRSVDSFLDHIAHQFCLSQKRFGWFSGSQFPLEKFLSPFLFSEVRMDAFGRADFQGTFDERYLVISYEGRDFHLEGPQFYLHADCVEEQMASDVVAVHYLDLKTWDHVGFLPLKHANYYQKNRDLLFTDAEAMVHFENKLIHIQEVKANWNQIVLKGNLEIEAKALDDVDLMIYADYVAGPACDAQRMLSHFSDSVFWEIPFEGEVESTKEAFSFHYHFTPSAQLVSGHLQGDFKGCMEKPALECSGHVEYDMNEIAIDFISPLCAFRGSIGKNSILLEGEDVSIHADRYEDRLHIDHFVFGSWDGEGDLEWRGKDIAFPSIQLRNRGKQGELVFSGIYNREFKVMKGALESFQWNFGEALSIWEPRGEVFGSGTFEWKLADGVQSYIDASFRNLEFGGIHFGDGENLSCSYSSKYGATVEGLEVEIPTEKGVEKYKLGCFFYDFVNKKLLFEGFDFSLPPEKLPWVAELAGNLFPGKVHPAVVDLVEALKQNEPLEGRISLEVDPDKVWVYLSLKDGIYHLSDKQFNLTNFLLLYDPLEFNIWTKVFYRDAYYWMHLLTDSLTMSHGKLEISEQELSPKMPAGHHAIVAQWARHRDKGWCVQNMAGNFHGIQLGLHASEPMEFSDQIKLEGRISFNADRVRSLLGEDYDQFFISGSYVLDGAITVPKSDFSQFSFSGLLTGTGFHLAGVELDSVTSELEYHPDRITLRHLNVKDWAGRLSIHQAEVMRGIGTWTVSCDTLKLQDVRFSRLKCPWTKWNPRDKPFYRSLFIRNFDLSDFHADLSDLESFTGKGYLEFTNLPRKTIVSNLLFIPTEITARIGLDLTALIPARGTIDYELCGGKIYFNEFKDMYSDGKHSRFYLAEGAPAYVDFAGNLNFKFKMKQYNLLMKLAELFTITVKGTLLHPCYTLSNQIEE